MLRKPTRPTMVHMPRRKPSLQLAGSSHDLPPQSLLRQPNQRSAVPRKCPATDPSPSAKSSGVTAELPRRIILSSYAREPDSLLREILSGKTKDPEPEKNYVAQINVVNQREIRHSVYQPAWDVRLHRLWKLQPGRYRLLGWDKRQREVLLGYKKVKIRTRLPYGVDEPPVIENNTFLEIGKAEDGQRHRVSVKWVSV